MRIRAIVNDNDPRQATYIRFLWKAFPEIMTEENPEMFFVIGGDGAMLHAHKNNPNTHIPFFGKGLGTLNFIMNNFESDFRIIEGLLNDTLVPDIIETPKIRVDVTSYKGGSYNSLYAINDVVIGKSIMDWNKFEISSEYGSFDNFKFSGMGMCMSTPLGSTAFNLNNGGKMLPINSGMWSVTSIVSEHKIDELMLPQKVTLTVKSTRNVVGVYIDGNTLRIDAEENDIIELSPSQDSFKLAFLNLKEFFNKRTNLIQERR